MQASFLSVIILQRTAQNRMSYIIATLGWILFVEWKQSVTGGGSYTGLTNLILTLKSNRLSILYQLHQNRIMLKYS
jgi:hypothetical protein